MSRTVPDEIRAIASGRQINTSAGILDASLDDQFDARWLVVFSRS